MPVVGTPGQAGQDPNGPQPPAVRSRFLAGLTLAQTGVFIAFVPLLNFLLPLQAAAIDPAARIVLLSQTTFWGGLTSGVANIVFGMLSDRTPGPFGRRRPWVVVGLVIVLIAYLMIFNARTGLSLIISVIVFQAGLNALFSPLNALLPDMVPDRQKGFVASLLGLAHPVATLFTALVMAIWLTDTATRFLVMAGTVVVLVLPMLLTTREPAARDGPQRGRLPLGALLNRDFLVAFSSRLLVQVAITLNALYLLFYVQGSAPLAARFSGQGLESVFGWLLAAHTVTALSAGFVGGLWSDRLGRRKIFIFVSGCLMATGMVTMVAVPVWPGPLFGQVMFGAGMGLFSTVDLALVTQVLPRRAHAGGDLGLMNLANSLPQVAAPSLGILIFYLGGQAGLSWTFLVAAGFAVVGGAVISFVRGVG